MITFPIRIHNYNLSPWHDPGDHAKVHFFQIVLDLGSQVILKPFSVAKTISALLMLKDLTSLIRKKTISMPLIIENPVRSPMVPPTRLNWASNLIFWSRPISSKVAVSK